MSSEHERRAREETPATINCGILSISDTRTTDTDTSGSVIRSLLEAQGYTVTRSAIVKDEPSLIVEHVAKMASAGCQVIVTNGGTGITRRDSTYEAIASLLDKQLPGFGELFRMLSYEDVGAAAMLSRATAGTYRDSLIFCLPGSPGAVRLAL
ncbi:MAG TPA: molybdenum cofactor biosynthesis protein B, partial [Roseiflexaceae bacterium]|nr:molybdenum cofactor biosynthesis protein B [Roseiflexaceae bacterium]